MERIKGLRAGIFIVLFFCCVIFIFAQEAQANITLKVLGVNPSKTQTQIVTLKAYLPKEVTPIDVMDKGDLSMTYDTQQGAYFVFGEYELKPEESVEREVVIKDIWIVPDAEIDNLRSEIDKTIELIQNTEFEDRANFLKDSIESKLDRIINKQKASAANPQSHISEYRDNLDLLDAAKQDLMLARSFLTQAKRLPSITIWKLFFFIVGFLAVLAGSLYFIWANQAKAMKENAQQTETSAKTNEDDGLTPEQHTAAEAKEVSAEDIEDLMKNE
ncbi:MAG: hypothetical protein ABII88_04460 [Candidatus Omnitrophota bacterium]